MPLKSRDETMARRRGRGGTPQRSRAPPSRRQRSLGSARPAPPPRGLGGAGLSGLEPRSCPLSTARAALRTGRMGPLALLGLLLAACLAGSGFAGGGGGGPDERLFRLWLAQNNKHYSLGEEYDQRFQNFVSNKRKIDKHNAGNHTFQMGLNAFSDMTFGEFRKKYLWNEPQNCSATTSNFVSAGPYPKTIDWRKKGKYVTPVKNQGPCGSCWTFSTTGCLESAIAIATGKLLNLAEQQLVDCAQNFNNHGCSGGLPSQAFEYILYNKGLMGEDMYPYHAENGTCKFQPQKAIAFVKDVINITLYDELGMEEAVGRYNPVSFAFEVTEDFMHYKQGVYTSTQCDKTPDKVNHAVLAVGYAEENGLPYWIVKNSWGVQWGMDGYFYIERGKNMCGLADCASYPVPLI